MERVYIFDCDRIIGDEEKRTIIENMEGKAEVIFDNSEGYDRDTDIVISTRCVRNKDVAGMEVIIREDIGVGCDYVGTSSYYRIHSWCLFTYRDEKAFSYLHS